MSEKAVQSVSFAPDQIVYTRRGREALYVAEVPGGHFVRLGVSHVDDGEERIEYENPSFEDRLFAEPPTEKLAAQVVELEAKVAELHARHATMLKAERDRAAQDKELQARLVRHRALERVADFIEGRFTHIVFGDYRVRIQTKDEALALAKSDEQYDRPWKFRLLSLYGRADGNVEWGMGSYSDGSGHNGTVYPCFSIEEARAKALELHAPEMATVRAGTNTHRAQDIAKSLTEMGIEVPADIAAMVRQQRLGAAQANAAKTEKEAETARAALEALSPSQPPARREEER